MAGRGNRIAIGVVGLTAVVGCLIWSAFATAVTALTCDGDGGFPFVARRSEAGRWCAAGDHTVYFGVELGLPIVCVVLGVVAAVALRRWLVILITVAVAVALAVAMAGYVVSKPQQCTQAQERASTHVEDCVTY